MREWMSFALLLLGIFFAGFLTAIELHMPPPPNARFCSPEDMRLYVPLDEWYRQRAGRSGATNTPAGGGRE